MKITITATDKLTHIDKVPVRLWEGVTESGIPCKVFVHRVAVRDDYDVSQFEAELKEQMPPVRHIDLDGLSMPPGRHIPLSKIL